MKNAIQKNDEDILKVLFYDLFNSYRIQINSEYQFVYDEFYEHLLNDTNNAFLKNSRNDKNNNIIEYKKTIFKSFFYNHYSLSQWFYKISNPENNKDVINELRSIKLKKIKNGGK